LRLETARNTDKKKSELYFYLPVKKILTKKTKSTLPQVNILPPFVRAIDRTPAPGPLHV
jgi:hypothetical protein